MKNKNTPYTPTPQPQIPGGERRYVDDELRKIAAAMMAMQAEIEALKARIAALEQ